MASQGLCAIDLLGVWNFKGKNKLGGTTLLNDFDYIAFDGRDVRIVYDSDTMTKPEVRKALERLTDHLKRKKAHVDAVYLPPGKNGDKVGVDDWLAEGHTVAELEALVTAPRPTPKPAQPIVELLDAPPPAIRRPLAFVEGRAYAAAWLPVRVTVTESTDKEGNIIKYNPPIVETGTRLFIIRDDGAIFGDGGHESFDDLDAEVILPEVPPAGRLWSSPAVKAYSAGKRPDPANVFNRLVDVVDRFLDFNRSFASQRTMAEVVACYVLSTWFLPVFNVVGYLWPNGDRGSGKTILLNVVAEMAYLGQVILAGGSYATLRDLADYGATLAFDDAENLSDPRRSDPDKRTLLLAGNRRGSVITVKEPTSDRTWRTRYVNAFCPRLFSAIGLPDDILASRSIVIPLIRTADRDRANADALDYDLWPHDQREIVDDLWALALSRLSELPAHEKAVSAEASLVGRNLEPWRGILAVARWLTDCGVADLWTRMEALSVAYQGERVDLETSDVTSLIIRSLCACARDKIPANCDISDITDISDISTAIPDNDWLFLTGTIVLEAMQIAADLELDIDADRPTSRRVGRAIAKLRLKKGRESGTGRRGWQVTWSDLEQLTTAYAISLPDVMNLKDFGFDSVKSPQGGPSANVTNVRNVTNVTPEVNPDGASDQADDDELVF